MNSSKYTWASRGDVNAFFGLMLDNLAGLLLTVTLLSGIFGFPVDFAIRYMIPGTAIGVLVGDLLYFFLAFRLAKRENRDNVTAMPLGLDTPSTIGMVLFVLGPSFAAGKAAGLDDFAAAMQTWHIGICGILLSGILKFILAFGSEWIRNSIPRAGLLGSLGAIALMLIAFMPLSELSVSPIVGFASLIIVLATLVARGELPFKFPGALGAVLVGTLLCYILLAIDKSAGTELAPHFEKVDTAWFPSEWLTVFQFEWLNAFDETLQYLPFILPFAIATVIGGIDCAESAAAAGDSYSTNTIIGIEALATTAAALCGGVIQTTPYIGHPAYKAMGGKAAYTLATALFIGAAGTIGYFSLFFNYVPKVAVLPILVFIGLEITAQSFLATPKRHYSAVAVACMPAIAKLLTITNATTLGPVAVDPIIRMLAGGFIITSIIWAAAMANIVDRKFKRAAFFLIVGGVFVLFGFMHSPLEGDRMFWPTDLLVVAEPEAEVDATSESGEGDTEQESTAQEPAASADSSDAGEAKEGNEDSVAGEDDTSEKSSDEEPSDEESSETDAKQPVFDAERREIVIEFALAYFVMAAIMFGLGAAMNPTPINSDEEYEKLAH
ncbi:MAG: permease [Planctomycetota bacterium]